MSSPYNLFKLRLSIHWLLHDGEKKKYIILDISIFLTKLPIMLTVLYNNQAVPLVSWIVSTGQSFAGRMFSDLSSLWNLSSFISLYYYTPVIMPIFLFFKAMLGFICLFWDVSFNLSLLHWIVVQVVALTTQSQRLSVQ